MRRTGLALALVMVACCAFAPSALAFGQVSGSPFATAPVPVSVAFSPGGGLLATANINSNNVSVFAVNQTTGALTAVSGSPFTTGSLPVSVAFSPGGGLLATANINSNNVSVFAVNQTTGALTTVSGSPFTTGATDRARTRSRSARVVGCSRPQTPTATACRSSRSTRRPAR